MKKEKLKKKEEEEAAAAASQYHVDSPSLSLLPLGHDRN